MRQCSFLRRCTGLLTLGMVLNLAWSSPVLAIRQTSPQRVPAFRRVVRPPSIKNTAVRTHAEHRSPRLPDEGEQNPHILTNARLPEIAMRDGWQRPLGSDAFRAFQDSWHRSQEINVLGLQQAAASSVYGAGLSRTERIANLVDLINQNLLLSVLFVFAAVCLSILGTRPGLRRRCTTMICVLERVLVPIDAHFEHARLLLRLLLLLAGICVLFWLTNVYASTAF